MQDMESFEKCVPIDLLDLKLSDLPVEENCVILFIQYDTSRYVFSVLNHDTSIYDTQLFCVLQILKTKL